VIQLHNGDCLEWLRTLDAGSVDAVVTDPPAGIGFMGKDWDSFGAARKANGQQARDTYRESDPSRLGYAFQGGSAVTAKNRDGFIAMLAPRLAEARRVIRPGGYALVWALPRTSHWTAMAIEEAGWTIRDRITHLFGTGFPKSKSCLKPGAEDWWLCKAPGPLLPLEIDAGRIGEGGHLKWSAPRDMGYGRGTDNGPYEAGSSPAGRWPPNVALTCCGEEPHDDDCPVRMLGKQSEARGMHSAGSAQPKQAKWAYDLASTNTYGNGQIKAAGARVGDTGTAARFYYVSKASRADRNEGLEGMPQVHATVGNGEANGRDPSNPANYVGGKQARVERGLPATEPRANHHPTVKSTDLMAWLIRLITPPGGTVLDPFMGSGSTGKAAVRLGMGFVGCELDPGYFAIAQRRIAAEQAKHPLFAST
jgi:DNA modification methylase